MDKKCIEYYMDSSIYSTEDVQASIDNTKKEFGNKNVDVAIELNKFGVYVITLYFENKNTWWNRIRIFFKRKEKNKLLLQQKGQYNKIKENKSKSRLEKYYGNTYGQYKSTKTYKPY